LRVFFKFFDRYYEKLIKNVAVLNLFREANRKNIFTISEQLIMCLQSWTKLTEITNVKQITEFQTLPSNLFNSYLNQNLPRSLTSDLAYQIFSEPTLLDLEFLHNHNFSLENLAVLVTILTGRTHSNLPTNTINSMMAVVMKIKARIELCLQQQNFSEIDKILEKVASTDIKLLDSSSKNKHLSILVKCLTRSELIGNFQKVFVLFMQKILTTTPPNEDLQSNVYIPLSDFFYLLPMQSQILIRHQLDPYLIENRQLRSCKNFSQLLKKNSSS